jgi:BirA family biotin operon repressor/biotin-[acetyl-CoA-carboxylase] ligase
MSRQGVSAFSWEGLAVDALRAEWRVPELLVFDSVDSTNDVVRARAEAGAPAGTMALAEVQTHGRGRRDRRWSAPPGTAILMSMLFRPAPFSPPDLAGTIPLRVGMAVARAIEAVCDVDVRLKWPNDILSNDGRKIAGVLCESSLASSGVAFTVVGVGVNVLQTSEQLHTDERNHGVSLRLLTRDHVRRDTLASALVTELLPLARRPASALTAAEVNEYASRDSLAMRDVTADGEAVGVADGISAAGELRVRDGNAVRSIHAGTIRAV